MGPCESLRLCPSSEMPFEVLHDASLTRAVRALEH